LGHAEAEHEKITVDARCTPEKVLTGNPCDQIADLAGNPATSPRQRPRDRYLQSADQPSRRQRKTVSGSTISGLSRQPRHQREKSNTVDQSTETWARRLRSGTAI
jgi:hypothetical protein